MLPVTFNINNYVWVKLTPAGVEYHRKHWEEYGTNISPPTVDKDGFSKFQLWEVMFIFGPLMYNGQSPQTRPFEMAFRFDPEDFTDDD